jgi:hypothetical protein
MNKHFTHTTSSKCMTSFLQIRQGWNFSNEFSCKMHCRHAVCS